MSGLDRIHRSLTDLLRLAEERAVLEDDGHLTIMRFTTGWKVMMGTPSEREDIAELRSYDRLDDALEAQVDRGPRRGR